MLRNGCSRLLLKQSINAPAPGSVKNGEEKEPAVKNCRLAFIHDRKQVIRCMHHEVRDSHFAGRKKSGNAREKSECNEETTNQLDASPDPTQHIHGHAVTPRRKTKDFLPAMAGEHETYDKS